MRLKDNIDQNQVWKEYEKILFRIAFVFFGIMCIPTSVKWYKFLFQLDWTNLHGRDLYSLTNFSPSFVQNAESRYGLSGYIDWGVLFLISVAVTTVWTAYLKFRNSDPENYNSLYYWLRVMVRYRAAIGIIGFGFLKLLPAQMPYPSLGILNTNVGDMTQQKIYWLSIGIVPWYQSFGSFAEILAGTLLLFRRTTAIGSVLLLGVLGAIVVVNLAYDNTLHVYASFFVLASAFLLFKDIRNIYSLLILEKITIPVTYYPSLNQQWQKYLRTGLKTGVIAVFLAWFFYLETINFIYDPYKQPSVKGLSLLRGNYTVSEFRINNQFIQSDPNDSIRWQEVTFEKWTSMSFKVNKSNKLDLSNGGGHPQRDINRTFEIAGVAGGRRVFHYFADTINHVLYLQDKNIPHRTNASSERKDTKSLKDTIYPENWLSAEAKAVADNEVNLIHPKAISGTRIKAFKEPDIKTRKKMILKYSTENGNKVILSGTDENRDSVYIVLERTNRKYALTESSLIAGQYK
jgi:hypothetical protein